MPTEATGSTTGNQSWMSVPLKTRVIMKPLNEYIENRWKELPDEAKSILNLKEPDNQSVVKLMWERDYWREAFEHLQGKVKCGCLHGFCRNCDPEEYRILSQD